MIYKGMKIYQFQWSLSMKDKLWVAELLSSRSLLSPSETSPHKLRCRTFPVWNSHIKLKLTKKTECCLRTIEDKNKKNSEITCLTVKGACFRRRESTAWTFSLLSLTICWCSFFTIAIEMRKTERWDVKELRIPSYQLKICYKFVDFSVRQDWFVCQASVSRNQFSTTQIEKE